MSQAISLRVKKAITSPKRNHSEDELIESREEDYNAKVAKDCPSSSQQQNGTLSSWHLKLDDILPPPILRMKRKFSLTTFLIFGFLKILCSLVMLNFYMASQISIIHLEDSVPFMRVHRDRNDKNNSRGIGGSRNATQTAINHQILHVNSSLASAKQKTIDNANNNAPKINNVGTMITPNLSDGTLQGKERLWNILQTRNVTQVDADYWKSIPTWDTILQNIHHANGNSNDKDGASPIIHGLETCEAFQKATASNPSQRRIAPAGIFNTGTNYLSVLLEYNCQNPDRVKKFHGNAKRGHGNEWEVPWGKHNPASSRGKYTKNEKLKYTIDEVLPVVLIRNPYGWMKSMCRNPYTAKWRGVHDKKTCPQLKAKEGDVDKYNPVDVAFGSGSTDHKSLAHLWNDWIGEYMFGNKTTTSNSETTDAPFPRLIIRFEDIIFFPYEVTKQVCTCAGGVIAHREDDKDVASNTFHYVVRSAKAGFGHGPAEKRNGLIDSWARYGKDPKENYSEEEIEIAKEILNPLFMDTFGYS